MKKYLTMLVAVVMLMASACGGGGSGGGAVDSATGTASGPVAAKLQSDAGDYVGGGNAYQYTRANAQIGATFSSGVLKVTIQGDQYWEGDFHVPTSAAAALSAGQYTSVPRYIGNADANASMSWYGEGRGCSTLLGSFTVANVVYTGSTLQSFDLTFEQHCETASAAMHGQIHWNSLDETTPSGPTAPPSGLWAPPAGAVPSSGGSAYFQSDAGDYVGLGGTFSYTQSQMGVTASGNHLHVSAFTFSGDFQTMTGLTQIQPGYYGNLRRYPFNNPATGGLAWGNDSRGCNTLTGWVVIDSVEYKSGVLSSIQLRFEQHCEGGVPALRGQIRWFAP